MYNICILKKGAARETLAKKIMFCQKCGTELPDNSVFCSNCGESTTQQTNQTYQAAPTGPVMPMKWYKFLIYFALFASAVLNGISGIMLITGSQYDGYASFIYAMFDGLQVLDIIAGVLSLGVAGLAVVTRINLAAYRANSQKLITLLYAGGAVINALYVIGLYLIIPSELVSDLDITSNITSVIVSAAMIYANKTYFEKRSYMFVN